ncbi:inosine/xanthosine triphosphatase [Meiothermus hypogaeus]|uniref:Probable inosine/xanthosine triphosphatase n=2 Tax=Meiothermus hypogaeus TaxID=884155 RepID=A0A511R6H5_9DEIN|nr:inosine/xanthosine triphosphatase [Meiothermus hypogaeus]RIH74304.1 Non-canonical purine NTP phosphatase [Meiothermus hypogaeus]GEM85219.1 non-canonical purine NTP phosphatase [Meiothermus hypogaeus NBRC 106114]GIW36533.1 MAG: non-canonical purine NTP phosphatase [Meiothermus sp.]
MVVVGSTNPAKLEPVRLVFAELFPELEIRGVDVPSGVREQPVGYEETVLGAENRARAALAQPGASWGLGLEAGVEFNTYGSWLFNIAVLLRADGRRGMARGGSVLLPPVVGERLRGGQELGLVMDDLMGQKGTKRGSGAVGILTLSRIERVEFWRHTIELAMPPFLRPELYPLE